MADIAILGGGVATLHSNALLQTLGTQKTYYSTQVGSTYLGANAKLQLWRNGTKVYERVLSGSASVSGGNLVLPTSWNASSTTNSAAVIGTGTWIFRIVKASDATKYVEGTVGPVGSGKHLILTMDLDGVLEVKLGAIILQSPATLDVGYNPGGGGVPVYSPQGTVDDMGLQNDYNVVKINPNWDQPAWAGGASVPPGAVVMGNRGRPDEISWWWGTDPDGIGRRYPNPWRYLINWAAIFFGSGHSGGNNAIRVEKAKMLARRRSDGVWTTLRADTGSQDWWQWDPSGDQKLLSEYDFSVQNPSAGVSVVEFKDPYSIPSINRYFPHGVWGGIYPFDPTPYDCLFHAQLVSLVLWNPAGADNRSSSQITYQVGTDYYPTQGNALPWYPGAGLTRCVQVTSTPKWITWANLSNANQAYNGPNASVSVNSFMQRPPDRALVEA